MKVLIIDDHEFTREGIVRILTDAFEISKVGRACDYDEAMNLIKETKWDLIIVDINLSGKSGLEIINSTRALDTKVPILVLSMVPVSQYLHRIIQAGATGYLTKTESAEEFIKAVRVLSRGLKYFSPEVQQELPDLVDESFRGPKNEILTDRELEILRRLAEGKSQKEIAAEYQLSTNTVNSYKKRVLLKLRAKTVLDLVRYAYEHGILQ